MSLGIVRPARPVSPALATTYFQRPQRPSGLADHGRREERTNLVLRNDLQSLRLQLRSEIDNVVQRKPAAAVRRWLRRDGLCGRIPLPGHIAFRHGPFLDWP